MTESGKQTWIKFDFRKNTLFFMCQRQDLAAIGSVKIRGKDFVAVSKFCCLSRNFLLCIFLYKSKQQEDKMNGKMKQQNFKLDSLMENDQHLQLLTSPRWKKIDRRSPFHTHAHFMFGASMASLYFASLLGNMSTRGKKSFQTLCSPSLGETSLWFSAHIRVCCL